MDICLNTLEKKRKKYLDLKEEICALDYGIDKRVEEYRQRITEETETDRKQRLDKVDTYLEVIDELILDAQTQFEKPSEEENTLVEETENKVE